MLIRSRRNQYRMDIFFLSYDERYREKHWQELKCRFPQSRRIHGIKGVALAHRLCAQLSKTDFFFVVNADNQILYEEFSFQVSEKIKEAVYTWRCLNPVNDLVYGFGGVKLFPKSAFFSFPFSVDISSALKAPYHIVPEIASVTCFNSSSFEAWRGAFRECVKLSSRCIPFQKDSETKKRLEVWCTKGVNKPFGPYVLLGAKQGREYGERHRKDSVALRKINDFDWLRKLFEEKGIVN